LRLEYNRDPLNAYFGYIAHPDRYKQINIDKSKPVYPTSNYEYSSVTKKYRASAFTNFVNFSTTKMYNYTLSASLNGKTEVGNNHKANLKNILPQTPSGGFYGAIGTDSNTFVGFAQVPGSEVTNGVDGRFNLNNLFTNYHPPVGQVYIAVSGNTATMSDIVLTESSISIMKLNYSGNSYDLPNNIFTFENGTKYRFAGWYEQKLLNTTIENGARVDIWGDYKFVGSDHEYSPASVADADTNIQARFEEITEINFTYNENELSINFETLLDSRGKPLTQTTTNGKTTYTGYFDINSEIVINATPVAGYRSSGFNISNGTQVPPNATKFEPNADNNLLKTQAFSINGTASPLSPLVTNTVEFTAQKIILVTTMIAGLFDYTKNDKDIIKGLQGTLIFTHLNETNSQITIYQIGYKDKDKSFILETGSATKDKTNQLPLIETINSGNTRSMRMSFYIDNDSEISKYSVSMNSENSPRGFYKDGEDTTVDKEPSAGTNIISKQFSLNASNESSMMFFARFSTDKTIEISAKLLTNMQTLPSTITSLLLDPGIKFTIKSGTLKDPIPLPQLIPQLPELPPKYKNEYDFSEQQTTNTGSFTFSANSTISLTTTTKILTDNGTTYLFIGWYSGDTFIKSNSTKDIAIDSSGNLSACYVPLKTITNPPTFVIDDEEKPITPNMLAPVESADIPSSHLLV
ncbi:MAG: hypothetical protein RR334_03325, partial [Clostridia bacterium]